MENIEEINNLDTNEDPTIYYTIVNDDEGSQDDSIDNKMVYFTLNQDCDETDELVDVVNNETKDESDTHYDLPNNGLDSNNLELVTIDGQLMLVSTIAEEEDSLNSIQPHLINNEEEYTESNEDNLIKFEETENLHDELIAEDTLLGDPDPGYNIVQIVDESQNVYNMIIYKQNEDATEDVEQKVVEQPFIVQKFLCPYEGCDRKYSSSSLLQSHLKSHTNSKPYECKFCEKTFSTNFSLKSHSRTHTGEKPYGCKICNKHFRTSGDLQKHVRIHTGEKPFVCPVTNCGKSFTTSNIRKVHIRSHTGERPYVCDYPNCGKAFSSSTNFKNHMRIHSGEKPYACNVEGCSKRFTEYSSLYKHSLVHQVQRNFQCNFCAQRFKTEASMNMHRRVKHNVIVSPDGIEILLNLNN